MGEALVEVDDFEVLPEAEQQRRVELEAIIEARLQAFVEFCLAMHEIKAKRLYRSTHRTWEAYCEDNLGLCRRTGIQYADAGEVIEIIQENVRNCAQNGQLLIPQNESQLRPLTKFKKEPERLLQVWGQVVEAAPEGKITAKIVRDTINGIDEQKDKDIQQSISDEKNKYDVSTWLSLREFVKSLNLSKAPTN